MRRWRRSRRWRLGNEAGAAGLECENEVKCGWVWFSNFYFYSLISLIEIYLV